MNNFTRRRFLQTGTVALGACVLPSVQGTPVQAKGNSQIPLSQRLYLGDIDGDQIDELIEVDGRHLYMFKCNHDHTPLLEHVLAYPVKRLIIGDLVTGGREKGKDQILAVLADGSVQGWAISDDLKEMWWWFTQGSFVSDSEHFIVGDFDGDTADEIMVYNPASGRVKLYELGGSGFVEEMANYTLGNLAGWDLRGKLLLAGDFGLDSPRTDLLVVDRGAGQVSRFDTANEPGGRYTFWWAFTSRGNLFGSADELIIANVDGGTRDSLVVRSAASGQYRMFQLEYNDGNLVEHTNVDIGQLPVRPRAGRIAAGKIREHYFRQEPGVERDDILFFDDGACEIVRTDARFDPERRRFTYWWAYTSNIVVEPVRAPQWKPWAILLCRFKGLPGDSNIESYFRDIFTPGSGGLVEFWHDVSLGAVDISGSQVFGWLELDLERKDAAVSLGVTREVLIDHAIEAARRAGIDPVAGFHSQLAVFTHDFSKDGAPPGVDSGDETWGPFWIDGSTDVNGRVSAPPHAQSGAFLAHEMGHGFGFEHDLAADLNVHYGDPFCIMSYTPGRWSFNHPRWNVPFGPAMSFPQLATKNWTLPRRVLIVASDWLKTDTGTSFTLAPMSDRKIDANIGVVLPPNVSGADWEYYLEYQRALGWNRAISPPRLVIRRRIANTAAYLGDVAVPSTLGGKADWVEPSGQVKFVVEKIRDDERMIRVMAAKFSPGDGYPEQVHLPFVGK